jgi:hypothetical protein
MHDASGACPIHDRSPRFVAPGSILYAAELDRWISSHSGNTDVTVLKSPPSIVGAGKPNLLVLPLAYAVSMTEGTGPP